MFVYLRAQPMLKGVEESVVLGIPTCSRGQLLKSRGLARSCLRLHVSGTLATLVDMMNLRDID